MELSVPDLYNPEAAGNLVSNLGVGADATTINLGVGADATTINLKWKIMEIDYDQFPQGITTVGGNPQAADADPWTEAQGSGGQGDAPKELQAGNWPRFNAAAFDGLVAGNTIDYMVNGSKNPNVYYYGSPAAYSNGQHYILRNDNNTVLKIKVENS